MKSPMVLAAERQGLTTSDPRYWALVAPPIPWSKEDEELVGGNDDAWLATFNIARVELGLRPLSPHGRPRCDLHNNLYGETYCRRQHDPCPFGLKKPPAADWPFWGTLATVLAIIFAGVLLGTWLGSPVPPLLSVPVCVGIVLAEVNHSVYGSVWGDS